MYKKLLFVCMLLLTSVFLKAQDVNEIFESLSLEQLTGQTIMTRLIVGEQEYYKDAIEKGYITGVFLKTKEGYSVKPQFTPEQQESFVAQQRALLEKTISDLREWEKNSPHKIPLLIAFDYEGGPVTSASYLGLKTIPSNMLMGAGNDDELTKEMFRQMALEVKGLGGQIIFGPVLDLNTNPKNAIIGARAFGDDAKKVGHLGEIAVKALQEEGVAAFVKHFPGHGDVETDSHKATPISNLEGDDLKNHISAFEPAIIGGTWGVLVNHVKYSNLDKENNASFSSKIITDMLKNEYIYEGVIATDDLGMKATTENNTIIQALSKAYKAGADLILLSGDANDPETASKYPQFAVNFVNEQQEKDLDINKIKESAKKILELKVKTGLFSKSRNGRVSEKEFSKVAKELADKGVTIVKNENNFLPLTNEDTNICTLFFVDPIAGEAVKAFNDTLKNANKNVQDYIGPENPTEKDLIRALACAMNNETVIIGSYQKYITNEKQQEIIKQVLEIAKKRILISLLSPYDLINYPEVSTTMAVYGPTKETMQSTAEIVLGQIEAQGKLPVKIE